MSSRRTVLVTGANGGIGKVTAFNLARHDWDVVGSVRTQDKADRLVADAAAEGLSLRTVLLDVTDPDACRAAVAETIELTGGLWALVNNAGGAQTGAVEDVSEEAARQQVELNLMAPARMCRLVLPHFRAEGGGRIVNVSSMAGLFTLPLAGWYSASKHALEALTDALRIEVADFGVRVVLVEPGSFRTDIWANGHDLFPEPAYDGYARAYERSELVTGNQRFMPDPIWVARTIRLALTSRAPLARYPVGVDAVGGLMADRLLPTVATDAAKAAAMALNARRVVWPL